MSLFTLQFALLLAVSVILCIAVKERNAQNIIVAIAGIVFYAFGGIMCLAILLLVVLFNYAIGILIDRYEGKKIFLIIGVAVDVLVLCLFKYKNFFADGFGKLLGRDFATEHIIVPLGISFFMLQAISYIADVYKKKIPCEKNPLYVLLLVGYFPSLTSGPILKAKEFLPKVKETRIIRNADISYGLQRIAFGAFKKFVVADRLSRCVDAVYAVPSSYTGISIALAAISYTIQIYFDFSGYSDMAIGISSLLGIHPGENFKIPYISKNPTEFWRRWHISLSTWFRDYVYFPLGGSRKAAAVTYINLMIVMILSGMWHGSTINFAIWGACHGILLVIHKIYLKCRKNSSKKNPNKITGAISMVVTFICVTILWIPFRAESFADMKAIFSGMIFGGGKVSYFYVYTFIFAALLVIYEVFISKKSEDDTEFVDVKPEKFKGKLILCIVVLLTIAFGYFGDSAFVYQLF